jgi:hypothetical protein
MIGKTFSDEQFYTNLSHLASVFFSVASMQKLAPQKKKKTETLIETQCHQISIASSGI